MACSKHVLALAVAVAGCGQPQSNPVIEGDLGHGIRDGIGDDGLTSRTEMYIKASNSGVNDGFGNSIAMSADGGTLAVGAPGEASAGGNQADNTAPNSGAVYVFSRGGTWSQQAYLKASNSETPDFFGYSIALSADGNTLAVGAMFEASAATGIDGNQADNTATIWNRTAFIRRAIHSPRQTPTIKRTILIIREICQESHMCAIRNPTMGTPRITPHVPIKKTTILMALGLLMAA